MAKINRDHNIFSTPEYQKDRFDFSLINQNLTSETLDLYSDGKTYIICRGKEGWPTWIWTSEYFSEEKMPEIISEINLFLTDAEKDKFTCKKAFYEMLVKSEYEHLNEEDYFEMGALHCIRPVKPKTCTGNLDSPTESDREDLIRYWYDDSQEMNGVDPITMEQAQKDVDNFLASDTFFVWRDGGKIVCMGSYTLVGETARVNHVYTVPDQRGKGYAANLIYDITEGLLSEGITPLLYTDYNYKPSNKAYINAGYIPSAVLINFSCSKNRKRNI